MDNEKIYGEQTKRALENFGTGQLPRDFIKAYGEVKKATLQAIQEYEKKFSEDIFSCIISTCNLIISGNYDAQFPLPLKQGGAGTSINMNFNEAIVQIAASLYELQYQKKMELDPLQDINLYQSTNDTFPTALTIMAYRHLVEIEGEVIRLQELLITKENQYSEILMTGRTEMQSALPITLGQVFGAWAGAIARDRWRLNKLKERVRTIALGGTALGTCFFAPREYVFSVERKLREITSLPLSRSQNLPDEISNYDKITELASGYQLLAENLFKMTGDLLLYTSSMISELSHPSLQYGSSIMAAKTNPVILEYLRGLAIVVQGEVHKIHLFNQNGQLQLNVFAPFIVESLIEIYKSLKIGISSLIDKFFLKMQPKLENIEKNLANSLVLLNSLVPLFGYNKVKEIYENLPQKGFSSIDEFKAYIIEKTNIKEESLTEYLKPFYLTGFSQYKQIL